MLLPETTYSQRDSKAEFEDNYEAESTYNDMHIGAMKTALLKREDTEEELMDRSKTNIFATVIAYGQMLWFGTNLAGRRAEGLAITKLEVASLAYVVMTLLTFFFWMNKPLDVDCPIVVKEAEEGDFGIARLGEWSSLFKFVRLDSFESWNASNPGG